MGEVFGMAKERFINARRSGFTTIINSMLDDPELSLQAKGLLSIFLSNSNDWEIHMKEIIKRSKNGRDAHYKAINELIENGYFFRTQVMEKGKFKEMIYIFSDNKEDVQEAMKQLDKQGLLPHTENQETEEKKPFPEKPDTGKPDTENQDNNNTKVNKPNTKNTKSSMYVSTDADKSSIEIYKENYKLTKYAKTKLESFIETHGEELTKLAVERTVKKGKEENMIAYIEGMLKNWAKLELKSILEVEAHEKKHWKDKKKPKSKKKQIKEGNLPTSIAAQNEIQKGSLEAASGKEEEMTDEELMAMRAESLRILEEGREQFSPID
jgi:DnaD/phage-associated family protein